jgi:hypothetical protein
MKLGSRSGPSSGARCVAPFASASPRRRRHCALYIDGMGARTRNFYNQLATRYGYADSARTIQDLYLAGRRRRRRRPCRQTCWSARP